MNGVGAGFLLMFGYLLAIDDPDRIARRADVEGQIVRLGDIADLSGLPPTIQARAAQLPIADMGGSETLQLSSERVATRARALMPALSDWLAPSVDHPVQIRRSRPLETQGPSPHPAIRPTGCARLSRALDTGETPRPQDLVHAECGIHSATAAFRYDADHGVVRARRPLSSGELVRSLPGFVHASVLPGDALVVRTEIAVVTIERDVTALQPAQAGASLFVRTSDGAVLRAFYPEIEP